MSTVKVKRNTQRGYSSVQVFLSHFCLVGFFRSVSFECAAVPFFHFVMEKLTLFLTLQMRKYDFVAFKSRELSGMKNTARSFIRKALKRSESFCYSLRRWFV